MSLSDTNLFLLPELHEIVAPDGRIVIPISLASLDPTHPTVPDFMKNEILKFRHHQQFLIDGIASGNLWFDGKLYRFRTKLPFESFCGFLFEAWVVRILNADPQLKRRAVEWCANMKDVKIDFTDPYKAVGTGLEKTRIDHIQFYNRSHPLDVKFITERFDKNENEYFFDPLLINGRQSSAGIQIKAITTNIKAQIIEPILSGKYSKVLTLLKTATGKHSYFECVDILKGMKIAKNGITDAQYIKAVEAIYSPFHLGLDQYTIDDYYRHAQNVYQASQDSYNFGVSGGESIMWDAAHMEVSGYHMKNSILVPDSLDGGWPVLNNQPLLRQ
jgi:hypothetical protein